MAPGPIRNAHVSPAANSGPINRGGRPARDGGGSSSASEKAVSADEIASLKEQLMKMQAELSKAHGRATGEDDIEPIERPPGEAGNAKNGFCLIEVMGLKGSKAEYAEYLSILRSVRIAAARAGVDFNLVFHKQDKAKLAAVYKVVRAQHPYMTNKRFPNDWAAEDMLKHYLRGVRRRAGGGGGDGDDGDDEDSGSDDDAN